MKFLITTTDIYRCDNEVEAQIFIEELKRKGNVIVSSTIQKKERKVKGEVADEWVRLTVKTVFNDEKDPDYPYIESNNQYTEKGDINDEF